MSCELLQESYTMVCDNNLMDSTLKQKIELLYKTIQSGSKNVKFVEEKDILIDINNKHDKPFFPVPDLCDLYDVDKSNVLNLKRNNESALENENESKIIKMDTEILPPVQKPGKQKFEFTKPFLKAAKAINVVPILSPHANFKMPKLNTTYSTSTESAVGSTLNSTFDMTQTQNSASTINSILTETNSNNPALLKRGML